MAIHSIQSLDDPRLAPYRSLKSSNETRWTDRFVVEGEKLVQRLLASRFRVHSLLVARRFADATLAMTGVETDVLAVDDAWIEEIVGFNFHRGILACAERGPRLTWASIQPAAHGTATVVVCPDVQDPENLGSILRTAAALGVDAVVLGSECCDPFSRRVLRVSMGAALQIPIIETTDLAGDLARARREHEFTLWAMVTDRDADALSGLTRPRRTALLLGGEGHGLTPQWITRCDQRVTIPMRPGIDSLNVAVAAGIALYELMGLKPQRPRGAEDRET